jgi:hypothetical protein
MTDEQTVDLVDRICALPDDWHGAGTVNRAVLLALARHCKETGGVARSAETGAGRTTLLLSHLSRSHVVFADESGESVSRTRSSALLRADTVTFVEGPTQVTLPGHVFDAPLQVVLLDGPHGYPFPDLEYFHFYPHLAPGGLLVLDDTRIPTVGRMLDILKADAMYHLAEVVRDTAFLRRTSAPAVDPHGDGWWLQGYNRREYELVSGVGTHDGRVGRLLRRISDATPQAAKDAVPDSIRRVLLRRM